MNTKLFSSVAFAALLIPGAAYAQSTGSVEFDNGGEDIVVTARAAKGIGGVETPDTPKAKGALNQAFISRQTPGDSVLNTINQLPGVSFQNNEPTGASGGTINIRGFDNTRISLTFDGLPANDTGGYQIYSTQVIDPELIEQVNVSYGSTDVDSPTASATGSTINFRTRNPTDKFAARVAGTYGSFDIFRVFGVVDTGQFTSFGTKAWFAASNTDAHVFTNDRGRIKKQQYNAKLYQPIGNNGDFVSIAGFYNQNRNNYTGSTPLRFDSNILSQQTTTVGGVVATPQNPILLTGAARTPGSNLTNNRFPYSSNELPYSIPRCTINTGTRGVADTDTSTSCGTTFEERVNPTNNGNIRLSARLTLAPGLVLTVDPSYQYTKANGGGLTQGREGLRDVNPAGGTASTAACATTPNSATNTCRAGYFAGNPFAGMDLNGDGDMLDIVNVYAPSNTVTNRYTLIAGLRWDFAPGQTARLSYTFDRGRHRQTGEVGLVQLNGVPYDVFSQNNPVVASNGQILQKRDRLSYATLNQISGEYRGEFFDRKLVVNLGVRAPFYRRDLNNYCFTSSAGGFVECYGRDAALQGEIATANPYTLNANGLPATGSFSPPQSRRYTYDRILPNVGVTYRVSNAFSVFGNYSKGLQVPGTDNLYNAFFFPQNTDAANPKPETTDNFDAGVRYTSNRLQAQIGPWYSRFTNRLASAFDPDTQQTVYRNLGRVDKYGIDGSIDFRPIPQILIHAFGSYLQSEIKNDVVIGNCPATLTTANTTSNCTTAGAPIYALTGGKRESGAPVYSFGGRLQGTLGPLDLGIQAKRTGRRYLNDQNLPAIQCTASLVNAICPTAANTPSTYTGTRGFQYQVFDAVAPGYTLVDLDARLTLDWAGFSKSTYFQFNVQNVFNKFYVGGFSGGTTVATSIPNAQIGSPRAFIGTLNVAF